MKLSRILPRLLCLSIFALSVTSCFLDDPNDPGTGTDPETEIDQADWKEIPASGGTYKKEDISLSFPAGTFSAEEKIGLSAIPKGKLFGDCEKSQFYQVTLPASGSSKSFTIKIKCPDDVENPCVVVQSPGLVRGTGEIVDATRQVDASYADGEMTVSVPAYTTWNTEVSPYFSIGLVEDFIASEGTKAGSSGEFSNDQYSLKWPIYKTFWNWNNYKGENRKKILSFLNENIPLAHQALKDFGFKWTTRSIPYQIEEFDDAWGYEVVDWLFGNFGDWYTYIKISSVKMLTLVTAEPGSAPYLDYKGNLEQTLVHETFHYIHDVVYDSRLAATKTVKGWVGDQWAMFSDAIACWTEKAVGDKRISENAPVNANALFQSFLPVTWGQTAYQDSGYAMAIFTEWLSQHTSDKKIPTLLDYQKEGLGSVVEVYEKFLNTNKLPFFNYAGYWSFVDEAIHGRIDSRVNLGQLFLGHRQGITSVSKTVLTDDVYNFGISVYRARYGLTLLQANKDKQLYIEQQTEGLITYIYDERVDGSIVYLGQTSAGNPYKIAIADCLAPSSARQEFTTITLKLDPKWDDPAVKSNVACWIESPPTTPRIWSVGLEGDVPNSWINEGWTDKNAGGMSSVTVEKVKDGYFVSAVGDYYSASFTITLDGNSFGDAINITNYRGPDYPNCNFTIDRLPLVYFDSGADASWGYARWKGTWGDGLPMDLDVYFDPLP